MWKWLKRLFWIGLTTVVVLFTCIHFCNRAVVKNAEGRHFNLVEHAPKTKVALLLGTGKFTRSGNINQYYKYRVEAAVKLFKAGKIEYIIISGDNGRKEYDEPSTFMADLVSAGIPEERIYLDYAGFRTLDSVVRCKAIFGQDNILIISQQFHNERAIYLADKHGIQAHAFNAQDVGNGYGKKTALREKLARVKLFVDLLIGKEPKFYGEPIVIGS